jgi:serine/threonine-protein kinase
MGRTLLPNAGAVRSRRQAGIGRLATGADLTIKSLDQLAGALADRYTIERELGRGGNGIVYLAHDIKHDRDVAVKVLPPELALAVRNERFLREIQIAAQLTHPHILALYDSGELDGFLYYVMPYVEGESLRDRLTRDKQLPLEDALQITREVAEALGYAHKHGVVHRDIKPENILLHEGHALLADFGIARALTAAGGETVTASGVSVGTPTYMSPEQATGSGEPDARSDLYSLGCVLYEMLVGHPPFTGATAQEILARHALDPVPSLRAARTAVPESVERALTVALAKQAADRFATASQFVAALAAMSALRQRPQRQLGYAAAGIVLLAGAVFAIARARANRPATSDELSVAVLPFVNLSGDATSEYFSDGMTEELINALVKVQGLRVPARTSSFVFKGKNVDITEIGRQLRVGAVVEGSVRRSRNSLRVTAQLIDVADGYHRWSETYERELRDVFAVQEEIARAIVTALEPKLLVRLSAPLVNAPTANLDAYDLYLRGRHAWHLRSEEGFRMAIEYFEAAVAQDSGFALAYSGLSDTYILAGEQRQLPIPGAEANARAKAAAIRAVATDDRLAEAHTSLARVRANVDGDYPEAEREFLRAISLNPRYALAHSWYGLHLRRHHPGRDEDAIREGMLAEQLDPLSAAVSNNLAIELTALGRFDEAIARYRKAIAAAPDWPTAHNNLARLYVRRKMLNEALAEFEEAHRLNPRAARGELGHWYGRLGRKPDALRMLAELRQAQETNPFLFAMVYAGLDDKNRAFASLEAAVAMIPLYRSQPEAAVWDPLRSDPRFAGLLPRWTAKMQVDGPNEPP